MRALIQQCLAGDQTAMLALVDCYQGQVFGLCYRMLGQRQDAEDMAQETFVRRSGTFRSGIAPASFCLGCWPSPVIAAGVV